MIEIPDKIFDGDAWAENYWIPLALAIFIALSAGLGEASEGPL